MSEGNDPGGETGSRRAAAALEALAAGDDDLDLPPDADGDSERLYDAVRAVAGELRDARGQSDDRRQRLYDVTSDPSLSSTEKIDRLLALGCEWFGVGNAYLSRIDAADGRYVVERAVGDEFVDPGDEIPLSQTFCRRTIDSPDILGIFDATETGNGDDPGYADSGIACYIGGRVVVGGDLYGTFCFFDDEPVDAPFTSLDRALVDLMARWVSYALERRERQRELRLQERAMEAAPVGISIADATDPDYPIVYANRRFEEITGYDADEVTGRDHTFLYGDNPGPAARELLAAREDGASVVREVQNYRRDGDVFWARVSVAPVTDGAGDTTHVVTFREDVTERVQNERRLEAIVENTDYPMFIKDRDGVYLWANEATADVFGLDREDVVGATDGDLFDPESVAAIREFDEQVMTAGEGRTRETETTVNGERHVWLDNKYPYRDESGDVVGLLGVSHDVTERDRRERALSSLHDATRRLLTVGEETEAAELVVTAAGDVLGDAAVAFYRFDESTHELAPVAHTAGFAAGDPPAVPAGEDAAPWQCFVDGAVHEFDDPETVAAAWTPSNEATRGLLVPVGDHGLFVVAAPAELDDARRQLVETAAATAEAAFDRLESEGALREHERELEARNERLERQVQVTDIMRTINQSLVAAESREAVETAVCEGLAAADGIRFAWVGEWNGGDGRLAPSTWAGDGGGYLDAVSLRADRSEPAVATARDGAATVENAVAERITAEQWREHAAACGFAAALAVPLTVDGHSHGVLAVYADEPDAFGDLEQSVFRELGETIADALEAVAARQALHADTHVELQLQVAAADSVLARLQAATGGTVEYEGSAGRAGDADHLFVTVAGADADAARSALDDLVAVTDYRHVASAADGHVFEVTLPGDSLPTVLARAGGSPRSVVADGDDLSVVVDVPASADVREYVDRLADRYEGVELTGRRDVERAARTREEVVGDLFEELTDRQLEVLRTAFLAGFFEWPRETTGEGVADLLDVSQPTVNRHLRLAQQRLLAALFRVEPPAAVGE
jgi:PAS domain S-box-containing protein